jgi:Zc3h12a-like Ribonuclease NYN domain
MHHLDTSNQIPLPTSPPRRYAGSMRTPVILLLISLAATIAARSHADYLLLTVPCLIAGLYLLLRAILRPKPKNFIIVDGSNVMHWKDGTPQVDVLRDVIQHLTTLGFTPGVIFDANAGHKIAGRYQHDAAMGARLGLPEDRIIVVPKGTPADPTILAAARDLGARIVTNDRYRDWVDAHPEIAKRGHLIRGGYRDGQVWLDIGDP